MDPLTTTAFLEGAIASASLLPIAISSAVVLAVWYLLDWLWDTCTEYFQSAGFKVYKIAM